MTNNYEKQEKVSIIWLSLKLEYHFWRERKNIIKSQKKQKQ